MTNFIIFSTKVVLALLLICSVVNATSYENFLDSLEDLLRSQSDLLSSFDFLLHKTQTTVEEKIEFLTSFEDLLRRQAILFSGFEDLLKKNWDHMDADEQEKFLSSFEDLLEREVVLFQSFRSLNTENWDSFNHEEQIKLLRSYEDLLRRQTNLLISFEELFKRMRGGIIIEKYADKSVIDEGDIVTYTYVVTNYYKDKTISDIIIIDDKLGLIVSGISLEPGETKSFTKSTVLYESTFNQAEARGRDPEGDPVSDESSIVYVLVRGGGIPEPLQYGQYCEASEVKGNGVIDMSSSIIDRDLALQYSNSLSGDGDIEMNIEQAFSEKASKLERNVTNKTLPLNFFENMALSYAGAIPLMGGKKISSIGFHGGIGAEVQESLSVNELEKKQIAFFASTDPATHVTDYAEASRLKNASAAQLVGLDTEDSFNGTWGTESRWFRILKKDIQAKQFFTGNFETKKLIKFHENPAKKLKVTCEGIDC